MWCEVFIRNVSVLGIARLIKLSAFGINFFVVVSQVFGGATI